MDNEKSMPNPFTQPSKSSRAKTLALVISLLILGGSIVSFMMFKTLPQDSGSPASPPSPLSADPNDLGQYELKEVDETSSALKGMWVWGNSVALDLDNRGEGKPELTPKKIAEFAASRNLNEVYLNVPWAANQGELQKWLEATVDALHSQEISVSALGGDYAWVDSPELAGQFVTDALAAADFDRIELNVEPWAGMGAQLWESDREGQVEKTLVLLGEASKAAGSTPLDMSLPGWLAKQDHRGQSIFSTFSRKLDQVSIVAFSDHAQGPGGILEIADAAASEAQALQLPFTIGLETDTPEVAGGPEWTFFEEGSEILEAQAKEVEKAYQTNPFYRGVAVEHYSAWLSLS